MKPALLDILRCPFCGGAFALQRDRCLRLDGEEVQSGILLCECCAYPVVAGIPYIQASKAASQAMELLGQGREAEALAALLGLPEERLAAWSDCSERPRDRTYAQMLRVLCADAEADYLFYRFSDPTFLRADHLLRSIARDERCSERFIIDVCGGSGHLTRTLTEVTPRAPGVVLADLSFWKLWLAREFVAPGAHPVCCDANKPLPFARDQFSLAVCADAFHYVWSKRLLADEMVRLVGPDGVVLLPHLHNALCENYSAGNPLSPTAFASLFPGCHVRVYPETGTVDAISSRGVDLSGSPDGEELEQSATLLLVASGRSDFFREYPKGARGGAAATPSLNPLYQVEKSGSTLSLRLTLPNAWYEDEFAELRDYLPEVLTLPADTLMGESPDQLDRLLDSKVLLPLPPRYV